MIRIAYAAILALALSAYSCDGPEIEEKIAALTAQPAMGFLRVEEEALEEVVEPEPPAPVYELVCWIEWHRAGTMAVEICENRLVE